MRKTLLGLAWMASLVLLSGCGCITFSPDPLYGYDPGYSGDGGSQYPAGWEPAPIGYTPATQAQVQTQSQTQTQTSTQTTVTTITGITPAQPKAIAPVVAPVVPVAPSATQAVSAAPAAVVPARSPAEPYFRNGENWERKGNCTFTLLNYGQAVKLDRNYRPGRAQYGIGRCFVRMGNCPKAIAAFRDAISATVFADTPSVYSLLADCEIKQGQFDQAEDTVKRGLTVHPNDSTLLKQWDYLGRRKVPVQLPAATPATAPVAVTPAPAAATTAPVAVTPVPAAATTAPVAVTPVPAAATTAPVAVTPAPAAATTAPVAVTPAPAAATTAPVAVTPAPAVATPLPVVIEPPVVPVPVPVEEVVVSPKKEKPAKEIKGLGKGKKNRKDKTNQGLHKGWDKNGKNAGEQVEPGDEAGEDGAKGSPEKPATPGETSPVPETKDVPGNPPEDNPGKGKD